MSYIELKDFGSENRGLKFNMAALDVFWSKVNLSGDVEFTTSSIYAAFYAGLIGNCAAKGIQQPDFDMEKVSEWVDELMNQGREDDVKKVCDMMSESTAFKNKLVQINSRLKAEEPESKIKKKKMSATKSS